MYVLHVVFCKPVCLLAYRGLARPVVRMVEAAPTFSEPLSVEELLAPNSFPMSLGILFLRSSS